MSFARRLVAGALVVLALSLLIVVVAAERSLRRDLETDTVATLEREARLVREALPPDSARWEAAVDRLAIQTGNRITLIDRTGRVRADSDVPGDSLRFLENHAHRPEVRAALAGRTGLARRTSVSVARPLIYLAIPGGPGVVRVAANRSTIADITGRARQAMAGAAILALLVGGVLALVAGRSMTRPLTAIAGAARDIATGHPPEFPASGIPEIQGLVQSLRRMDRQLSERFAALRREQSGLAALVETMVEGVLATDARGAIVLANAAAHRLLGYGPEAALPDLPALFRVKSAREAVDAVLAGRPVQDRQLELDDRTLLFNARPFPDGGAVLVLHDVTELRRLEAVRRDFVANVSHELKTPLTSIAGYTETLLDDRPDPDTTARFLDIILANARRMHRLVDDLLDLARIESGRWQPAPAPTDAAAIARECWSALAERAQARGVGFTIEPSDQAPSVPADPDALRQILTNLLDNALRYTPVGGRITCRITRTAEGGSVAVSDTGSGIPREHLPRVFERFYRVDPSRSREEGGTGLGLAIVKHLTEAHGGRVAISSELGAGTTVTCWFPA